MSDAEENSHDEQDTQNEDMVHSDGPYLDEEKDRRKALKHFKDIIAQVNEFENTLLHNPQLWFEPELQHTRQFIEEVNQNPSLFPPIMTLAADTGESPESSIPPLTKGFAERLYEGKVCDNHDIGRNFLVVLVTNLESRYHTIELGRRLTNQEKRYTLHAADGDENIITIKIATQINGHMGTVKVGSVIELRSFRRGFMPRLHPEDPERLAILVSNFRTRGSMEVKDSLLQKPTKRLIVQHPEDLDEESSGDDDEEDNSDDNDGDDETSDEETAAIDDKDPSLRWKSAKCTSSKRLCHKHGYGFDVCVTEAYPIDEFILEEIARECWFVNKEVEKMAPNEKRNILYWWFMVNVYHISGKDKRKRPPRCLIKAIREQYPNPPGVPYVDFRAKKRKRRR